MKLGTNHQCNSAGISGGSRIEVLELGGDVQSIEEEAIELDLLQNVRQLDWTPDGLILTVAAQVPFYYSSRHAVISNLEL